MTVAPARVNTRRRPRIAERSRVTGDQVAALLSIATITLSVIFLVMPLVVAIAMAFDSRTYLGQFPPPGVSVQWFENFFGSEFYIDALTTSIIVAAGTTAISLVVGTMAAVFIDRYRFPGRQAVLAAIMSPLIVPTIVLGFALFLFLSDYITIGNTYLRLIAGHMVITVPYIVRTMIASLAGIDPALREAALSLGAKEHTAFKDVILPLAKTGLVTGAIFSVAVSFDDVAVALFLADARTVTLPVALLTQLRGSFDLTIAAAATMLVVATTVLVILADRLRGGLDRVIGTGVYRR